MSKPAEKLNHLRLTAETKKAAKKNELVTFDKWLSLSKLNLIG